MYIYVIRKNRSEQTENKGCYKTDKDWLQAKEIKINRFRNHFMMRWVYFVIRTSRVKHLRCSTI